MERGVGGGGWAEEGEGLDWVCTVVSRNGASCPVQFSTVKPEGARKTSTKSVMTYHKSYKKHLRQHIHIHSLSPRPSAYTPAQSTVQSFPLSCVPQVKSVSSPRPLWPWLNPCDRLFYVLSWCAQLQHLDSAFCPLQWRCASFEILLAVVTVVRPQRPE